MAKNLSLLAQALQDQMDQQNLVSGLAGPGPTLTGPDIMGMQDSALNEMNIAQRLRNRPMQRRSGGLGAAVNFLEGRNADRMDRGALEELKKAYMGQHQNTQHAAKVAELQQQVEMATKVEQLVGAGVPMERALLIASGQDLPEDMTKDSRTTLAKQAEEAGYAPGTPEYQEFIRTRAGAATTNINLGDKDFMPDTRPGAPTGGVQPRPGSAEDYKRKQDAEKADADAKEAARKEAGRKAGVQRAGGTVVQDLGRAMTLVPEMIQGDGIIGGNARYAASKIKGSAEWLAQDFIESAKSNIGLDRLQQMRENSPTGGALGQVPIAQQLRLEQVLGQINVEQPPDVMLANMQRIQNIYFDIMYGSTAERELAIQQGLLTQAESDQYESMYHDLPFDEFGRKKETPGADVPVKVNSPQEANKLPPGTVYMTPDGRKMVR